MDEAVGSPAAAATQPGRTPGRIRGLRARVRSVPGGAVVWRVGITLIGLVIIAGGVVLLPLPGPGVLIIFAGLGLLATEYEWASRLLGRGRQFVGRWGDWTRRQGWFVRIAVGLLGVLFLVAALLGSWYLYRLI
ncbi:MAG: TIGR02611 family protein [Actinomycetota bacterium]|nr:TIGR02611 family protein [Actinomycetota bacterium]